MLGAVAWSFSLNSFWHAKELVFALALPLLALTFKRRDFRPVLALWPLWLTLAAALTISGLGTQVAAPAYLWEDAFRFSSWLLFATLTYALCWRRQWRTRLLVSIELGAVLVALLALAQWAGLLPALFPTFPHYTQPTYSVFGNQDFLGGYLAIALPLTFFAALRRKPLLLLHLFALVLLTFVLLLSESRSAWLAAVIGIVSLLPHRRMSLRRLAAPFAALLSAACLAFLLTAPRLSARLFTPFHTGDTGGRARLWFWDTTRLMIAEHPLAGVGLGQFRVWSSGYAGDAYTHSVAKGAPHYHNELLIEHAHSVPLELWAELGLASLLVFAWVLTRSWRCDPAARAGMIALLVFSLFNASIHCAPFAIATLLFGMMLTPPSRLRKAQAFDPDLRGLKPLSGLAVLLLVGAQVWTTLVPSYLTRQAHQMRLGGAAPYTAYQPALQWPWPNYEAYFHYGAALVEEGEFETAQAALQAAAPGTNTGQLYWIMRDNARARGMDPTPYEEPLYRRWPWRMPALPLLRIE